jgi:steroid 5-alpha reductase family enzyme
MPYINTTMPYLILVLALIVLAYILAWYIVSLIARRMDVIDIACGLGFFVVAIAGALLRGSIDNRMMLVGILVALWSLRLASHLFRRVRSHGEDARYGAWRKQWGKYVAIRSLVQVFLLQGVLLGIISSSISVIMARSANALGWLDLVGVIVWILGYIFEVIGDRQLQHFVAQPDNRGKLMTSGLWKYSRHPNYFGELTMWWGIWLISLSVTNGLLTIIAPLTITFLLRFVSGVPLLEKKYAGNPDWEIYRRKTSVLIPLPPRS